ncbi:MAG: hypothetical protein M3Y60_05220 [Bacteroidota bacterium]|nr:hypothetical protein [Bacteroidota bacterium]
MGQQFFYLHITAVDCEVNCLLNGFPVYQVDAEGEIRNQIAVILYLVGKNNKIDIIVRPHLCARLRLSNITS